MSLGSRLALRAQIFADVLRESADGAMPLTRHWLANYEFDGLRIPLIDAGGRGIRNPHDWDSTLSITTTASGPYPNTEVSPGVWNYPLAVNKYGDLDSSNAKLANAKESGAPVLYFYKPVPHTYLLIGQVQVTHIDFSARTAIIELLIDSKPASSVESVLERNWVMATVKRRLHQPRFRTIVLDAYRERCAVCGLPEASLLDAAHIRRDGDPNGQPVVQNGLALCAIHHRAFDAKLMGIDPELKLHVHRAVLETADGPVWKHALQDLPDTSLAVVPSHAQRPDPYRLELTFKEFLARKEAPVTLHATHVTQT